MSVIIASLLTVVALSYSLHSGLPKISYLTVIDWFFVRAYLFLGLAMAGMVWIGNLAHQARPKPSATTAGCAGPIPAPTSSPQPLWSSSR